MVSIVICYRNGTSAMLKVCLDSVLRHTKDIEYATHVVRRKESVPFDARDICLQHGAQYWDLEEDNSRKSSRIHGYLLDMVMPNITGDYVLTLDSDCFPVADGWLSDLVLMIENGASCSGILHPWAPPPESLNKKSIEWRLRSQQCWLNTHVACQLLRLDYLQDLLSSGLRYEAGDDTGLLFPNRVWEEGGFCAGFKPTRCPRPLGEFDAEYNRYVHLVFGDKVYHRGGHTREDVCGDEQTLERFFKWADKRLFEEGGAEWLLNDEVSYRYRFDKEEMVALDKMNRIFGLPQMRIENCRDGIPPNPGYRK
jgi:hypothetical protein